MLRVKVEADPSNDEVPLTDAEALLRPSGNYFEHHVKLLREAAAGREGVSARLPRPRGAPVAERVA